MVPISCNIDHTNISSIHSSISGPDSRYHLRGHWVTRKWETTAGSDTTQPTDVRCVCTTRPASGQAVQTRPAVSAAAATDRRAAYRRISCTRRVTTNHARHCARQAAPAAETVEMVLKTMVKKGRYGHGEDDGRGGGRDSYGGTGGGGGGRDAIRGFPVCFCPNSTKLVLSQCPVYPGARTPSCPVYPGTFYLEFRLSATQSIPESGLPASQFTPESGLCFPVYPRVRTLLAGPDRG